MTPTTETSEVISAIFKGIAEYKERSTDGLSKLEIGSLLLEMAGPLKNAAVGIQNVHTELLGLDDESREALIQLIGDHLVAAGVTHRKTDIALSVLDYVLAGSKLASHLINLPPAAEPVNE